MKRCTDRFHWATYVIFFIIVGFTITCGVLLLNFIEQKVESHGVIAIAMLGVVLEISLIITLIDVVRRRYMVERPVNKILEATEKIASGQFDIELEPVHSYERYDAYDLIMENINKMAAELAKNEVLKTDFISNVSHEIKTPLTVINNYATLLQGGGLSEEEYAVYTKKLLAATKRLGDLVANILKLNKLENQVIREKRAEMRLGDFIGDIVLSFEEAIDDKGIELECDIGGVVACADSAFVEIICNNLLSNAIKFTDRGGKISVSLKEDESDIILSVCDTGCGMSAETGAHIFDKFYQGDTSHAEEGNGLGLALVKRVIDNMGGEISVKSELGKGSAFTVRWKK